MNKKKFGVQVLKKTNILALSRWVLNRATEETTGYCFLMPIDLQQTQRVN